jgi:ribosome-associated protein
LRKISGVTDFFVICGSDSTIGAKAIAEAIQLQLKMEGVTAFHIEGFDEGTWILADYGDVIVHVFVEQVRRYYDLESLWGDAPRKSFRPRAQRASAKARSVK